MYVSKRAAVALLTASALAGAASTAVSALGHPGHHRAEHRRHAQRTVLDTSLAPSVTTDPTLMGVMPGGVNWVLRSGEATLRSNGRLDVSIRGLVIPTGMFAGTTGPVMTVDASLYCSGNPMPVGTSGLVPISTHGNARIRARFTLPAKCQIPALLIHPNGGSTAYIATSGFDG
jgi:hypothetical protein